MGIQNYLKRVSKATKDIKSAIEEKGVSVAQCDGFETLANKVRAIQTGTGSDGSSLFTVLAFKSSQTKPETPTGGSFTASAISYPSGWSDGAGLSKYVWMSYIVFKGDGSVYKNWVSPILVNGIINDGGDPIDLTDLATRTWVTDQIKNAIKNGTLDLSTYATKSYVDQRISEIPGGGGNFVESINGATGAITFAGSGVSKSGNTFTFNGGSGSDTITSINGETGELTFTGSGVSKNGKTFTFSGGSSTEVTKDYVDTQDASTLQSAKDYADGLVTNAGVTSINSISGSVTLKGSDTVIISRGSDGQSLEFSAIGGTGGGSDTIRSFNIYQNNDSREVIPDIPSVLGSEPYWDITSGDLNNCPTGWSTDMTFESDKYTWMASAFFSKNNAGAMVGSWEGPICITGKPGEPGKDGSSFEFIYALTRDTTSKPNYPTTLADKKRLFDEAESGDDSSHYATWNGQKWYDRAQAIDSTNNKACWAAQRVKYSTNSDWIYSNSPILWANWGSDGTDGDGVEYIFFQTDDAHQAAGKWYSDAANFNISYTNPGTVNGVTTNYDNTLDDWVPQGWTDEPQDVSEDVFYEFCSIRKSKNGVWQEFSVPSLWAKYAMDGKDGASIEYVFACTNDDLTPEQVSIDNAAANADGAHTKDEYLPNFNFNGTIVKATDNQISVTENNQYQWVSLRRRKRGATEWEDFSHPAIWTKYTERGYNGDTYATAQLFIAHTTYDENNPPAVPVVTSTYDVNTRTVINPPTGWDKSATKTTDKPYIWTIWGSFSENTGNQVGEWSKPYCITGAPGPAGEDGDEIEEVYCLNNAAVIPTITSSGTDQNGKTKSEDGFLPKFVFNGESKDSVASQPSVTEELPYCYGAKRRKHNGTWLAFSDAYLCANYVKQGLSTDDKNLIKSEVESQIGSSLDATNRQISAIQSRVDNIDGTDATFFVDKKEGIINAITQYKSENQSSFSDLVLDGSEAKVKAWAGGEFTENGKKLIKDAGVDLDGIESTVRQWATFYDESTMKTGSVRQILDAEGTKITTEATKAAEDKVNIATTKWDASITNDVAKAHQFWAKYKTDGTTIDTTTEYDLSNVGEGKTYANVEAYENAMKGEPNNWTKVIVTDALSRISQEAGRLTFVVNEGTSWASIVAKANESTGSELCLDADRINLSGTTNATKAVIGNAIIQGATITNGSITEAKINSCTIASQIKSKDYCNGTNPDTEEPKTKKGFLFDAASAESEFAIYARSQECATEDPDVVISSSEIKLPAATVTGTFKAGSADITNLTVNLANVTGLLDAKNIKGKTITADQIAAKTITTEELATGVIEGITNDVKSGLTDLKIKSDNIDFTGSDGTFIGNLNRQTGLTVNAANINGTLRADKIEAGILDCDKFLIKNLTWDKLTIEADKLKAAIADIGALTAGTVSTKNPDNTGTVEIEKNYIVLTDKNNNAALNVTGDDFAVIAAPIQQEFIFTGAAQQSAIDISNELNSVGYKELKFTGETNSVNFNNYNNLQIRLNSVKFNLDPNISCSPDEYDYNEIDGIYHINITLYVNNNRIASNNFTKYCYHVLGSGPQDWIFGNEIGAAEDSTIEFGSCLIPSVSSESVSIKFKIEVTANWSKSSSSNSINNFQINSRIYSASQKVIAQTIGSAKGVVIGANGFRAALDGENYAQFSTSSTGEMEFLIQAGGTSGYGINVKKDGIQMKLAGVWYAVTRGSDGNLQLN